MNRKQRRKLEKKIGKDSVRNIEAVEKEMSKMDSSCSKCGKPFDKDDVGSFDNWHIAVYDSRAVLTCDSCL